MSKLSDRQRKQIVAEYVEGDGKISQRTLAIKYNVSQKTISTILGKSEVRQKVLSKKAENTQSTLEWLEQHNTEAQELMSLAMNTIRKKLEAGIVSVKEAVGAYKVFAEIHADIKPSKQQNDSQEIKLIIEDASVENDDGSGD